MSDSLHSFSIGDRVRVSERCYDTRLRGAIGIVSSSIEGSVNQHNARILFIEFDESIPSAGSSHPIDGTEVDADDLDRI
jgi:hypothetical protein